MELLTDLAKVILPATLVLFAVYLSLSLMLKKDLQAKKIDLQAQNLKILMPISLQAYERLTLFLERISPENLLIRLNGRADSVALFQQILISEIRDELNHNASQQVYVSNETWKSIKQAYDEVVTTINIAAQECKAEEPALVLSKKILQLIIDKNINSTQNALETLKTEVRNKYF
ncbi:MAG: hypothetical protein KA313_11075 [Pseudarcicella sp.]|nr:hypothetical protein [Pseudarcicella sp.]MBP6411633.1 hypothetical protein [Pseudarcicella sp.]